MGNFISKNHRIGTAQRLAEGVGEDWYGFIAGPKGSTPVTKTDAASLDNLSRQILAHAPISNNNFALMANYTPNGDNNSLISLADLSYYGENDADDGSDVVVDYTDTELKVFKVLYKGGITGGNGTHIKISDFDINLKEKEFPVYLPASPKTADGTINIKYHYMGTVIPDDRGNFYLQEENIFPVRFKGDIPDNTNPGGVENIQVIGTVSFDPLKSPKEDNSDGFYPAIINGDGQSGKVEVYVNGSDEITSIKVVDSGKYFKDADKLKLSYTDNTDIEVDAITANSRTNYFKFIISPPEGHGISGITDEFEMAKQFSFVGLKFYTKMSEGVIKTNISNGVQFYTTGLFRKRKDVNVGVYNVSVNDDALILGDIYKIVSEGQITGNFSKSSDIVSITYTDADYRITDKMYIKIAGKIFRIKTKTGTGASSIITIEAKSLSITGLTSFSILEARGVAIKGSRLLVIPNEDGVYQSFRSILAPVIKDTDSTKETKVSEVNDGKIYADIMSFDTTETPHTWETGNNIYFSQIILL